MGIDGFIFCSCWMPLVYSSLNNEHGALKGGVWWVEEAATPLLLQLGSGGKIRGIPKMEIYILLGICKHSLVKSLKPTPRTWG